MLTENETSTSDKEGTVQRLSREDAKELACDFAFEWYQYNHTNLYGKILKGFEEWMEERKNYYDKKFKSQPDYRNHLSNLIKIIESLESEHGHSLNREFKKQFEDAKKLLS